MQLFLWCWTGLFTTTVLPLSVAALRGWAPRRTRGRVSRARTRVQGVSLLVLYAAAMVHPLFRLADVPREDADFFLPILFPALMFLAMGLQAGAALHDRFSRTPVCPHHAPFAPACPADGAPR